jgi:hypothetical protein
MSRDATFLLALGMLATAAFAVGVSGWILFVRDRRLATAADTSASITSDAVGHHEAHGEE